MFAKNTEFFPLTMKSILFVLNCISWIHIVKLNINYFEKNPIGIQMVSHEAFFTITLWFICRVHFVILVSCVFLDDSNIKQSQLLQIN